MDIYNIIVVLIIFIIGILAGIGLIVYIKPIQALFREEVLKNEIAHFEKAIEELNAARDNLLNHINFKK